MKNQLDKIIYFVKNTGDKVIVLKDDAEFVVIPLDDYEGLFRHKKQLAAMSEEEMLSRVNREIALWRESQKEFEEDEEARDYPAVGRLRDDGFYYNNNFDDFDDKWVESDWQDDEDYDDDDAEDELEEFFPAEDFELPPELSEDSDWAKDKKGLDDVALPLREDKVIEPVIRPKTSPKRVNNFGYANPSDTDDSTEERGYGDDYDHIPPPPDR